MKKLLITLTPVLMLAACACKQPPAPPQPTVRYACTGGAIPSIGASYANNSTTLSIQSEDGQSTHTLTQTPSPNGQRYTDARSNPAKAGSLVWYTNAGRAILYVVTPSPKHPYRYEKVIADCTLQN